MTKRLESKKINRQTTILKYCGIGLIAISLMKLVFINQFNLNELGEIADSMVWLIGGAIALYISQSHKLTDRHNQFIEWDDNKVIYKLAGQNATQELEFEQIKSIATSVDKITLTTKDDSIFNLDLSDFNDFEERREIKARFETIKVN